MKRKTTEQEQKGRPQRFRLDRETILVLNDSALLEVRGGEWTTPGDDCDPCPTASSAGSTT